MAAPSGSRGSCFESIQQAPVDQILAAAEGFLADDSPDKMDLSIGAYRTAEGKPLVLSVVRTAEQALAADESRTKEYLPISGEPRFCALSAALAFGSASPCVVERRVATIQSLSGTGALTLGATLLAQQYPGRRAIYLPVPSWGNHRPVFEAAGLEVRGYRYYQAAARALDYQGLLQDLRAMEPGAVVLLQACAHNPTGVDPTPAQWRGILDVVQERRLLPFFDSAYQGFASGDLDADAAALRLFAGARRPDGRPQELMLAQSFSKNMGLYGERVGMLSVVCADPEVKARVEGQLKAAAYRTYGTSPAHGAALVAAVLGDAELAAEWRAELAAMAGRIRDMRSALVQALAEAGAPGTWGHITSQIGMFSYTGLTRQQCIHMRNKWHIYMPLDGRMNMAGVSLPRVQYLAAAMADAVRSC